MPLDARRMGIDYAMFDNEASTLGIGGASENFVEPAYLAFVGDEAAVRIRNRAAHLQTGA